MIRLREAIERGLRHPIAGPALLLLLAVLVVFVAMHETTETPPGDAALACAALALVVLTVVPLTVSRPVPTQPAATPQSRAPPLERRGRRAHPPRSPDVVPLRL